MADTASKSSSPLSTTPRPLTKEEKMWLPSYHTHTDTAQKVASLNDRLRRGDSTVGKWRMSAMVSGLSGDKQRLLIRKMQGFDSFDLDNDPYGEHDQASFHKLDGMVFRFKIDCYDRSMQVLSSNPTNVTVTRRVLTLFSLEEL